MKPDKKKTYEKPKLTQIRLDAECAVLGGCKTTNKVGPGVPSNFNCAPGGTGCNAITS
jgi:hypothetical protein